jgi:hypothetical protein
MYAICLMIIMYAICLIISRVEPSGGRLCSCSFLTSYCNPVDGCRNMSHTFTMGFCSYQTWHCRHPLFTRCLQFPSINHRNPVILYHASFKVFLHKMSNDSWAQEVISKYKPILYVIFIMLKYVYFIARQITFKK